MEVLVSGLIGIIGTTLGVLIQEYLSHTNNLRNAIYNSILEQYKEFVNLKQLFDSQTIDVEIYQTKDFLNTNALNKDIIMIQMEKMLHAMQLVDKSIGKIKKHMLNNQYLLENNKIYIENIIKLNGSNYKNAVYKEILNYKYYIDKFNINELLSNENEYIKFMHNYSEQLICIKVEMEKILFKKKFANFLLIKYKNTIYNLK